MKRTRPLLHRAPCWPHELCHLGSASQYVQGELTVMMGLGSCSTAQVLIRRLGSSKALQGAPIPRRLWSWDCGMCRVCVPHDWPTLKVGTAACGTAVACNPVDIHDIIFGTAVYGTKEGGGIEEIFISCADGAKSSGTAVDCSNMADVVITTTCCTDKEGARRLCETSVTGWGPDCRVMLTPWPSCGTSMRGWKGEVNTTACGIDERSWSP